MEPNVEGGSIRRNPFHSLLFAGAYQAIYCDEGWSMQRVVVDARPFWGVDYSGYALAECDPASGLMDSHAYTLQRRWYQTQDLDLADQRLGVSSRQLA